MKLKEKDFFLVPLCLVDEIKEQEIGKIKEKKGGRGRRKK